MAETERQKRITGRVMHEFEHGARRRDFADGSKMAKRKLQNALGLRRMEAPLIASPPRDPNPNPTQPPLPPDMPPASEPTGIPQPGPDSVPTPSEPLPIPPGSPPELPMENGVVLAGQLNVP
jgi:hypothetical protein